MLANRVTSIVGPTGIGKTALSKYIAFHLEDRHVFYDGIAFLDLSEVSSASEMLKYMVEELCITSRS